MIVVLMGVSGSGKTTIGRLLAERTVGRLRMPTIIFRRLLKQKMAAGQPLTDEDAHSVAQAAESAAARSGTGKHIDGVLACSALKETYHDILKSGVAAQLEFVFLDGSRELIAERLASTDHEYMNPKLLDSQLATLEIPRMRFRIVNDRPPDEIVHRILAKLERAGLRPRHSLNAQQRGSNAMGHPLFDLTGKTAVVVGGTSGIGLAMAVGLAEAGADVVASSRRQEQVDEAAGLIESRGRKALRLTSDVADRATLQALLDETLKAWGKVDILINCAGKIKRAPTVDFPGRRLGRHHGHKREWDAAGVPDLR